MGLSSSTPSSATSPFQTHQITQTASLRSSILQAHHIPHLRRFFGDLPIQPQSKLLFRASPNTPQEGWFSDGFHAACDGKGPTITIAKVIGSDRRTYVFGAFAAVEWIASLSLTTQSCDPSGTSFVFSLENAHDRPIKFRLKPAESEAHQDVLASSINSGPWILDAFRLMQSGKVGNSAGGNSAEPLIHSDSPWEVDSACDAAAAGVSPPDFKIDEKFLAGAREFALHSIEVHSLSLG